MKGWWEAAKVIARIGADRYGTFEEMEADINRVRVLLGREPIESDPLR